MRHRHRPPLPKPALENCFPLGWPIVPVPISHIPVTPWFLVLPWYRRANSLVPWEPAERIDSERCGRARSLHPRDQGRGGDSVGPDSVFAPYFMFFPIYLISDFSNLHCTSVPLSCYESEGAPVELVVNNVIGLNSVFLGSSSEAISDEYMCHGVTSRLDHDHQDDAGLPGEMRGGCCHARGSVSRSRARR